MDFRIADTFTDSLARLTGDEQKAVKSTAFDLQLNPANPGMSFHKLDRAKDPRFWSVRVGADLRLMVHKSSRSLLLCYVDHHDKAYAWAERRKLEVHPTTGAAQFVEVRERVEEIRVRKVVEVEAPTPLRAESAKRTPKPLLFAQTPEQLLLGFGVPAEWLDEVRGADEDSLLDLFDHLRRSLRAPRRAAPLPCGCKRGGTGASLRGAVGEVDDLPAPGSASVRPARLQRPGARFRLGGHRQDHRGPASCGPPGARQS